MFYNHLKLAAILCLSLSTTSVALAESLRLDPKTTPESKPCPVYAACGPGMIGYITGIDENGCEKMGCHPEGEQPIFDYPTGDGLPKQERDQNREYKYDDQNDKNAIPPRAIEVQ